MDKNISTAFFYPCRMFRMSTKRPSKPSSVIALLRAGNILQLGLHQHTEQQNTLKTYEREDHRPTILEVRPKVGTTHTIQFHRVFDEPSQSPSLIIKLQKPLSTQSTQNIDTPTLHTAVACLNPVPWQSLARGTILSNTPGQEEALRRSVHQILRQSRDPLHTPNTYDQGALYPSLVRHSSGGAAVAQAYELINRRT